MKEGQGKRILIVEVNWLGDVLFSTPFIRALRLKHPDSYIACLVHPRCAGMLKGNTRINEIIIYDEEGKHRGILGKLKLVLKLRGEKFDTAYILHRSFTKALIAYLSGAKDRIGYPTKNRARLLTRAVEEPDSGTHKVDYFVNLLDGSVPAARDRSYEFFVSDDDRRNMAEYLLKKGISPSDKVLALCPGGNWGPKRWAGGNFAKLSDLIAERYGVKVVITGGEKEKGLAADIKSLMKSPAVITCGDTSLQELGAIFERSSLVVANDTGSMHIAVAMGAPVIALFGPTSPELTGPYGKGKYTIVKARVECDIPCYDVTCLDNRCMKSITVDEVSSAAGRILNGRDI